MKLLTLLLLTLTLTACDVTNMDLRKANHFCKNRGELNSIIILGEHVKFRCNNGEIIAAHKIKLIPKEANK